ncbi:hypothetical protein NCCP2050_22880 [Planococcus sp. NCCP-2050]|nr:hypothetical protein NCCP2050_22880 [Planococcus sp. NCCP-2050]
MVRKTGKNSDMKSGILHTDNWKLFKADGCEIKNARAWMNLRAFIGKYARSRRFVRVQ